MNCENRKPWRASMFWRYKMESTSKYPFEQSRRIQWSLSILKLESIIFYVWIPKQSLWHFILRFTLCEWITFFHLVLFPMVNFTLAWGYYNFNLLITFKFPPKVLIILFIKFQANLKCQINQGFKKVSSASVSVVIQALCSYQES